MKNQLLMTRPEPETPHRNDRDDFAPSRRVRRDRIEQLDRLSRFLDSRYRLPVLNVPVGWDSILGLIPGVGALVTLLPGGWMTIEALRMGARKRTVMRMVGNTLFDAGVGTVPVIGDLVDLFFKSHRRNMVLLKDEARHIEGSRRSRA